MHPAVSSNAWRMTGVLHSPSAPNRKKLPLQWSIESVRRGCRGQARMTTLHFDVSGGALEIGETPVRVTAKAGLAGMTGGV